MLFFRFGFDFYLNLIASVTKSLSIHFSMYMHVMSPKSGSPLGFHGTSPSRFRRHHCMYTIVITARKRSLGQGNIFTPVYHSVHRGMVSQHALQVVSQHALQQGGACSQGGAWSGGAQSEGCLVWRGLLPEGTWSGGSAPGAGLLPRGDSWWRTPERLLPRVVRILLECILVLCSFRSSFVDKIYHNVEL